LRTVRVLDLFCGAGGAALGYNLAGYEVFGVDIKPQPRYPFKFLVRDVERFLKYHSLEKYHLIHASPPCQAYSQIRFAHPEIVHPELIDSIRALLHRTGKPWIIENVPGAPLIDPIILCGTHFGLGATGNDGIYRQLRRHRLFESNLKLSAPAACSHRGKTVGVYGDGGGYRREPSTKKMYTAIKREAEEALGIMGMTMIEYAQALPPVYTKHLGKQARPQIFKPPFR
jgi:DNA (cytosine-5)-methyltransferase 1